MSGFNKVTSFILGLIVVVVFLVVFGSRFRVTENLEAFKDKTTPTPTLSVSPTPKKGFFESLFARKATPTPTRSAVSPTPRVILGTTTGSSAQTSGNSQAVDMGTTPKQIPNTGPSFLLPILISSLGAGIYLRKRN